MRKLMFVAAAIVAGTVFANGIVSSSVVGYQQFATTEDDNLYFVPTFLNVGSATKVKLSDIKPDEDWDSGFDWLGTLNSNGLEVDTYTYDGGHWYVLEDWSMTETVADDVEITLSHGLVCYSYAGSKFTFSGQVVSGDTALYTVEDDNAYTGNFLPTQLRLGDIVPDSNWDSGFDWLGTVNNNGLEVDTYTYDNGNWYVLEDWNITATVANDVEFDSGASLVVYTYGGAELSFPGAVD